MTTKKADGQREGSTPSRPTMDKTETQRWPTIAGPCFDECDRGLKIAHKDGTTLPCRCRTLIRCETVEVVRIEPEEARQNVPPVLMS